MSLSGHGPVSLSGRGPVSPAVVGSQPDPWLVDVLADAAEVAGRSGPALELARRIGPRSPLPGAGETRSRWELLAGLSAVDLTAGRVAEAHLDALAILAEAAGVGETGAVPDLTAVGAGADSTWGVFAAEGPGVAVTAQTADPPAGAASRMMTADPPAGAASGMMTADPPAGAASGMESSNPPDAGWMLSGVKPWCSLADRLDHALITAHVPDGRRLFAIALRQGTVTVATDSWVSRGLADVPSGPITLTDAPAVPVGATGWYLQRPGFAWGGLGVAACWYGGAVGLARDLHRRLRRRECDQIGRMHLGAVDTALVRARAVLALAAAEIDAGRADGSDGVRWAARVREVVAGAAEEILLRAGHALGPAPLALDEEYARRVADLTVYLRQHHAERDQAALGSSILDQDQPPW